MELGQLGPDVVDEEGVGLVLVVDLVVDLGGHEALQVGDGGENLQPGVPAGRVVRHELVPVYSDLPEVGTDPDDLDG